MTTVRLPDFVADLYFSRWVQRILTIFAFRNGVLVAPGAVGSEADDAFDDMVEKIKL